MQALRRVFASYFQVSRKPAADVVVLAFAAVAKSNMLCMADILNAEDRCTFSTEVLLARTMFQQLCEAAAFSADANPRSHSATLTPTPATRTHKRSISTSTNTSSNSGQTMLSVEQPARETAKAATYTNDKGRPNVHAALHHHDMLHGYGLP